MQILNKYLVARASTKEETQTVDAFHGVTTKAVFIQQLNNSAPVPGLFTLINADEDITKLSKFDVSHLEPDEPNEETES